MADVAGMNMEAVDFDFIDASEYDEGGSKGSFGPPPEKDSNGKPIKYFGTLGMITDESFSTTRENRLKLNYTATIVNPNGPGDGYEIKFQSASSKKYSNRNASQMMDLLRAAGLAVSPSTPDELKAYLKMASGKTIQFTIQWRGYDKATQETFEGADQFVDDKGVQQTYRVSSDDATKRVWANASIRFFVSAVGK